MGDHIEPGQIREIDPGQMSIYDILEEPVFFVPPAEVEKKKEPTTGLLPKRKTEQQKWDGLLIRFNEYHLDKKMVDKHFLEWAEQTGIQVGDFFRIQDVKDYYKANGIEN